MAKATLIEQTQAREGRADRAAEDATAKAQAEYTKLLGRNAAPQSGDSARLATVMATLKKTTADLAADVAMIESFRRIRARSLKVDELQQARGEAIRRSNTTEEKAKAEMKLLEDSIVASRAEADAAERRWVRSREAGKELGPLRQKMKATGIDATAIEAAAEPQTQEKGA